MGNWQKILVAIDETDTSMRAIHYIGEIAACTKGLEVNLLHVYPDPPPNYHKEGRTLDDYKKEKEIFAQKLFDKATNLLDEFGIQHGTIKRISRMASGETISKSILQVQKAGDYGTVVVGKRGVSKAEEFLFGSISNSIVRNSVNFAVWVVG